MNTNALILFLKYPEKGKVKTRLALNLGKDFAYDIYQCFVRDTVEKLMPLPADLHLCLTPPHRAEDLCQWLGMDISIFSQQGDGLGTRMKNAFHRVFQQGYERVLLMGCDMPDLPVSILKLGFEALTTAPSTIGPTRDGGYYAIGFNRESFREAPFQDIPWSTAEVFRLTMKVFQQEQLRVFTLPMWQDVDRPEDLDALYNYNRESEFRNSRTMTYLRSRDYF